MAAEIVPLPSQGLGAQLRELADYPGLGYVTYGGAIVSREEGGEPPIFSDLQEKCATTGVAQVIHFPRHRGREG